MKTKPFIVILSVSLGLMFGCQPQKQPFKYESENIKVKQMGEHSYRHISYLVTNDFGKVGCNGMIVVEDGEAIVFDTPTNDEDSKELISMIQNELDCEVVAVVVTHFHKDCLGGLAAFHQQKIPSYASFKTLELSSSDSIISPMHGFKGQLDLTVGNSPIQNVFLGEGHTVDNIVSYYPKDSILFGGCLVKCIDAGNGYLGDANVSEWSSTVEAVKLKFPLAKVIIPGHGKPGGQELLDYTIEMFQELKDVEKKK